VIAPEFDAEARRIFASKASVRVLSVSLAHAAQTYDFKRVGGGCWCNLPTHATCIRRTFAPSPNSAHTGANRRFAVCLARGEVRQIERYGVLHGRPHARHRRGANEPSRRRPNRALKAQETGVSLEGSVVASDAFFPFRDGVEVVARAGAKAVIQPGGSVRDEEAIAAPTSSGLPWCSRACGISGIDP